MTVLASAVMVRIQDDIRPFHLLDLHMETLEVENGNAVAQRSASRSHPHRTGDHRSFHGCTHQLEDLKDTCPIFIARLLTPMADEHGWPDYHLPSSSSLLL